MVRKVSGAVAANSTRRPTKLPCQARFGRRSTTLCRSFALTLNHMSREMLGSDAPSTPSPKALIASQQSTLKS
ncbi:protein of unknown function (plasmid) [Azospirillum baldaniorum]|uniref:Uncharacterized protein n=1 Tax=Azospirillum baldaniorum TaxID=1064539 RepID=A0A9P1NNY7_9PROT|nr:protein of unknown function [Azospirillum baldaniorum]